MNNKQKETLKLIFKKPISANIRWKDVESLFLGLGCKLKEGNGSRVRIEINNIRVTFHRPHPSPFATKPAIKDVAIFLNKIGVNIHEI